MWKPSPLVYTHREFWRDCIQPQIMNVCSIFYSWIRIKPSEWNSSNNPWRTGHSGAIVHWVVWLIELWMPSWPACTFLILASSSVLPVAIIDPICALHDPWNCTLKTVILYSVLHCCRWLFLKPLHVVVDSHTYYIVLLAISNVYNNFSQ